MEKYLFQNEAPKDREQLLKDNCDAVEVKTYMRNFSQEELAEMKDELADESIELDDIEFEKKQIMQEFKARIKPHSERVSKLLGNIRNKAELVEEDCYKIIDLDDKVVGFYNKNGELVESRPARQNELTKNIFAMNPKKTGTND